MVKKAKNKSSLRLCALKVRGHWDFLESVTLGDTPPGVLSHHPPGLRASFPLSPVSFPPMFVPGNTEPQRRQVSSCPVVQAVARKGQQLVGVGPR